MYISLNFYEIPKSTNLLGHLLPASSKKNNNKKTNLYSLDLSAFYTKAEVSYAIQSPTVIFMSKKQVYVSHQF